MFDRRVTIYKNGCKTGGKVLLIPQTFDELLSQAYLKLNIRGRRLFTETGGEIDDIDVIRENDVLYLSDGEDFKSPNNEAVIEVKATRVSDWVTLNVGGKYFTTTKSTLTSEPCSMLARMFAENDEGYHFTPSNMDAKGAYLIDRSPTYFEPIINYLRNGQLIYDPNVNPAGILDEAKFFGVDSIIPLLEQKIQNQRTTRDNMPLTRRDVVDALIKTPYTAELRFQGTNLSGADLSKLDLRYINFKYANLQGCNLRGSNLSWCCLERADLSYAKLDTAQLLGVKGLCANLEGAELRNCNFEDPAGNRANLEGAILKGASLEGSQMCCINLRVAALKNANLQNCDLMGAVLAGADLENCNLSGSNLDEANLRGANLKGAAFERMLTPLHMSQTIR